MNRAVIEDVFEPYLDQRRWVEWRSIVDRKTGERKKLPYTPGTNKVASTNKPETWGTYWECTGDRIGIVFNGDGLGGVDLDGCRNPATGAVTDWALHWIDVFDCYVEISPSGTGLKLFAFNAPKLTNNVIAMPGEPIDGKKPQIEAYSNLRYFAVTGDCYECR